MKGKEIRGDATLNYIIVIAVILALSGLFYYQYRERVGKGADLAGESLSYVEGSLSGKEGGGGRGAEGVRIRGMRFYLPLFTAGLAFVILVLTVLISLRGRKRKKGKGETTKL